MQARVDVCVTFACNDSSVQVCFSSRNLSLSVQVAKKGVDLLHIGNDIQSIIAAQDQVKRFRCAPLFLPFFQNSRTIYI